MFDTVLCNILVVLIKSNLQNLMVVFGGLRMSQIAWVASIKSKTSIKSSYGSRCARKDAHKSINQIN